MSTAGLSHSYRSMRVEWCPSPWSTHRNACRVPTAAAACLQTASRHRRPENEFFLLGERHLKQWGGTG